MGIDRRKRWMVKLLNEDTWDDNTGNTFFKHFQGTLMHKVDRRFPVFCTLILTLLLEAPQTRKCAKEKEKMSCCNLQGMPTLHFSEMLFSSFSEKNPQKTKNPLVLSFDVFACTDMLGMRRYQSSHHQSVKYQKRPFFACKVNLFPGWFYYSLQGFFFFF